MASTATRVDPSFALIQFGIVGAPFMENPGHRNQVLISPDETPYQNGMADSGNEEKSRIVFLSWVTYKNWKNSTDGK